MIYHSEPITRRYIEKLQKLQIEHRFGVDRVMANKQSQEFSENWEKVSSIEASHEERSEYFSTGEQVLKKLVVVLSLIFLISIPFDLEARLGASAGFLLLPFTVVFSLWLAFRSRIKRANANHTAPPFFSKRDLINRMIMGLVGALVIVFLLFSILISPKEFWF